jgi:cytochrome c oxidase assembly protein subunit 15
MNHNRALHWFALLVFASTLGLVAIGGLVTSHGVGMSVPDWPTSYGYNMFALPFSLWLTGGVFHEHTHRLWASEVGLLTLVLSCWLYGKSARGVVRGLGILIVLGAVSTWMRSQSWPATLHLGLHGIALFGASYYWPSGAAAPSLVRKLGIAAVIVVIVQGLLGGLRVVLDAHVFAGTRLGTVFGVFHGCLAQVFLVLLAFIALMTSRWWMERRSPARPELNLERAGSAAGRLTPIAWLVLGTTMLVFLQLLIGATMRHQHAGLAIWDFPLAHGAWWPDTSAAAIERYNATRVEVAGTDPITAFQVGLQMVHRLVAVGILLMVGLCVWRLRRWGRGRRVVRLGYFWLALVLAQAGLGAWTVWSHKAADVATFHVVGGALTLVTGALITVMLTGSNFRCCDTGQDLAFQAPCSSGNQPAGAAKV